MDPITAISLAIGAIKLGIEIYQYISADPTSSESVKAVCADKIDADTRTLQTLEDTLAQWEKTHDPEVA